MAIIENMETFAIKTALGYLDKDWRKICPLEFPAVIPLPMQK